jgi:hypothetical protein
VKIIFVGDNSQLPPIGETFLLLLAPALLQQQFGLKCQHSELTEVVRQATESPILKQAHILRQALSQQQFRRLNGKLQRKL